jgi:hypothetical protein
MNRHFVVIIGMLLAPNLAIARTPWPEGPKRSYAERCAESMSLQGLSPKTASTYCVCTVDGMSKEFGMEEYNQMMKAEPKENGSSHDRRLYRVFTAWSFILPR